MIHLSRIMAAAVAAAALIITGMSPASAAQWTHDDAVGDVQRQTTTFGPGGNVNEGELTIAPANTDTDVTRISVNHLPGKVVLKTALRDLTVTSGAAIYEIRTGARRYSVLQRLGTDRAYPAFAFERANGNRVRCAGVQRSVDRAADLATLQIPRHCLGRPQWVRVGAAVAKVNETRRSFTFVADDALRDAAIRDALALSPRVRRA